MSSQQPFLSLIASSKSSESLVPESILESSSFIEIEHIETLSTHLGALFLSEEYSDIVLVVQGHRFPSHRVLLAARSEYFRALLYGSLKESSETEIELKETPHEAFKLSLEYIYTGKLSLNSEFSEELLLEMMGIADRYGFSELEISISEYFIRNLNVQNVCYIYDSTFLYRLENLSKACLSFMDTHASELFISQNSSFSSLSPEALREIIRRDSFCVEEVEIFKAVVKWVTQNSEEDYSEILSAVRLSLMSTSDLLKVVRPTGLVRPDIILDSIESRSECRNMDLNYRGYLIPDENVASTKHQATVLVGECKQALLDGDDKNYDMDRGFSRHLIDEAGKEGIVIRLGLQCIINHIRLLLWDKDQRCYSYYIEVSMDQQDWIRVVDYSKYHCRSWQNLYFSPRVVRYIRVVGTHNTVNSVFHLVSLEAFYRQQGLPFNDEGFVLPTTNVATIPLAATVIEGVSRTRNSLLNGNTRDYDWDFGYTCHQLGSGAIVIQLGQPYAIDSMRLLLWDCDSRTYSYYIEVSLNKKDWIMICDRTREPCKSWQNISFPLRPVIFIRIVGTHNTENEVFHCVHFEAPALIKSSKKALKDKITTVAISVQENEEETNKSFPRLFPQQGLDHLHLPSTTSTPGSSQSSDSSPSISPEGGSRRLQGLHDLRNDSSRETATSSSNNSSIE